MDAMRFAHGRCGVAKATQCAVLCLCFYSSSQSEMESQKPPTLKPQDAASKHSHAGHHAELDIPADDPPLWSGSKWTKHAKDEAILRGLEYLLGKGMSDDDNFFAYGYDYLMCIWGISHRSNNYLVQQRAGDIGRSLGRKWKREYTDVPEDADASEVLHLMYGLYAVERLGMPYNTLKNELRHYLPYFKVSDYLHFHPAKEKPPHNAFPLNSKHPMSKLVNTKYIVWYNALVASYVSEKLGLPLDVTYQDVLRHLPDFRPYQGMPTLDYLNYHDQVYGVTNLLSTLSDYARLRLDRTLLLDEFAFAYSNVSAAISERDTDMVGSFLDSLRMFGLEEASDPTLQQGVTYLLASQNMDGSWGNTTEGDQEVYHPTCAAIHGLAEHVHHGFGPSLPALRPVIQSLNGLKDEL